LPQNSKRSSVETEHSVPTFQAYYNIKFLKFIGWNVANNCSQLKFSGDKNKRKLKKLILKLLKDTDGFMMT